jgi:two-component system response regulator WspF
MRIAIVNDLKLAVEALRRVIARAPEHQLAWIAYDGREAVEKCAGDTPDLVLMDLIMPVMDGVEATRQIMKQCPCAVLVVTATVSGNAAKVFDAMGHGALDAVCTPVLGADGRLEGGDALLAKIATIGRLIGKPRAASATPLPSAPAVRTDVPPLAVLGASTGGPMVLVDVLRDLLPDLGLAVVVVQHVDAQFATALVDWIGSQCAMPVREVRPGESPPPGVILVAGREEHLVFRPDLTLAFTPEPRDCAYRPSVDAFFRSAAGAWPGRGLAALLTGMGRDGAEGLLELRRAGWHTIAQDRDSSIVWGMPGAAVELKAAAEVLSPAQIARALQCFARAQGAPGQPRGTSP